MAHKKEWIFTLKRIMREYLSLEKNYSKFLSDNNEELLRLWRVYSLDYDSSKKTIGNRLNVLKGNLKSIKDYIQSSRTARDGTNVLQIKLEKYEAKLADFKSTMRKDFDELVLEETIITNELGIFSEKASAWISNSNIMTTEQTKKNIEDTKRVSERFTKDLERQSKIGELDRKVALLGGRYGHWDSRDHDMFLRICTQLGTPSEKQSPSSELLEFRASSLSSSQRQMLVRRCCLMIPAKNEQEINDHIDWYDSYLTILREKKILLDSWKKEKHIHQQQLVQELDNGSPLLTSPSTSTNVAEGGDAAGVEAATGGGALLSESDRRALKERVTQWKQSKIEEEERKKKLLAQQAEEARRSVEDEIRRRQQQSRLRLQQWKEQKESQTSQQQQQGGRPRSSSVDPAEIRRRAARDLETARSRLESRETKQRAEGAREATFRTMQSRLREQSAGVARSPSQLLAPTAASMAQRLTAEQLDDIEHRRAGAPAHSAPVAGGGYDLKFVGRATPSWINHALR